MNAWRQPGGRTANLRFTSENNKDEMKEPIQTMCSHNRKDVIQ